MRSSITVKLIEDTSPFEARGFMRQEQLPGLFQEFFDLGRRQPSQ
jgi:hypothetical protein